ncbi:MAG: hypothetical protein ACJ780_17320 [Solirubrobacteraceae bacterium]
MPEPAVAPEPAPPPPFAPPSSAPPAPEGPPAPPAPEGLSDGGGLAAMFPPDQPERAVGAAFAGGFILALVLKRLAR